VWRALTAVMVTAVVLCSFGAFALAIRPREVGLSLLLWLFGGVCVVATERHGSLAPPRAAGRRRRGGVLGDRPLPRWTRSASHEIRAIPGEDALRLFLLTSALTWAAACWRWGSPLFAGLSVAAFFVLLAQVPFGRVLWIVVRRRAGRCRRAASRRRRAGAVTPACRDGSTAGCGGGRLRRAQHLYPSTTTC
jgi:hypothetical protein